MIRRTSNRVFWLVLLVLATLLIIGITNNLNAQFFLPIHMPEENVVTAEIYENGTMIMLDSTEICFIYDTSRRFMLSGDTLKILIRKE